MTFLEIIQEAKTIVEIVDEKDDIVLDILEKVALLPFMPAGFGIAIALLKKYDPEVVKGLLFAIDTAEKLFGVKAGEKKLEKAIEELPGIENSKSLINFAVSLINKVAKK